MALLVINLKDSFIQLSFNYAIECNIGVNLQSSGYVSLAQKLFQNHELYFQVRVFDEFIAASETDS